MEKTDLLKHMMNELDFYVKHHDECEDSDGKKEWEKDYKRHAKAFNNLLTEIYGPLNHHSFSRTIEKYKEYREWR